MATALPVAAETDITAGAQVRWEAIITSEEEAAAVPATPLPKSSPPFSLRVEVRPEVPPIPYPAPVRPRPAPSPSLGDPSETRCPIAGCRRPSCLAPGLGSHRPARPELRPDPSGRACLPPCGGWTRTPAARCRPFRHQIQSWIDSGRPVQAPPPDLRRRHQSRRPRANALPSRNRPPWRSSRRMARVVSSGPCR